MSVGAGDNKTQAEPMSFDEAMVRARAEHVTGRTFYQPGNGYEPETECSCGLFVYHKSFDAHVLAAADALREGFRLDGSAVLFVKRVAV